MNVPGRASRKPRDVYLALAVPGLEGLVAEEIGAVPDAHVTQVRPAPDARNSGVVFELQGDPRPLLDLTLTEDVFALFADVRQLPQGPSALGVLYRAIQAAPIDRAASRLAQLRPFRGRPTFRVIARVAGSASYWRRDVAETVAAAITARFPGWRKVEDDAIVEIWSLVEEDEALIALRLSDATMRHRSHRQRTLPASLKPTVARAMVVLSGPRPDDVFLDPLCGAGTILLERAHADRYRLLLGGDIDPDAVGTTSENIGKRYQPIKIERWDARSLPLDSASVTALVTNLPFGRQVATAGELPAFYAQLIAEFARVLMKDARLVILAARSGPLHRALETASPFRCASETPVLVRGFPAVIHVIAQADSQRPTTP